MPHTEESKARIAAAVTERWRTRREELREKVKAGISEEEKAARSARMTGEGNPQFGVRHTEEHKEKLRELNTGEGNAFFGKKHSAASIQRMRRAKLFKVPLLKKYGVTPEIYEEQINSGNYWCTGHREFLAAGLFSPGSKVQKPNRCRRCVRARELKLNFGVTLEWYEQKLVEQHGKCALCHQTPEGHGKALSVDHNHQTGAIRGLLCFRCNTAIERVEDIEGWGGKAVAYLAQYLD